MDVCFDSRPGRRILLILILWGGLACGGGWSQAVIWETSGPFGSFFGHSLGRIGDVTGDGFQDLAVGAVTGPTPSSLAGMVFALDGADGSTHYQVTGPSNSGGLGFTVGGPGDLTGDGVPDVLAGSISLGQGRLYDGTDGALVHSWPVASTAIVGAAGDANGDGVPDVLVGAQVATTTGVTHLFSGADYSLLYTLTGPVLYGNFGSAVTGLGDVDGDGLSDLLIGAAVHAGFSSASGKAYVFSGSSGTLLDVLVGAGTPLDRFGTSVTEVGDVTGDGIPDMAVGAPGGLEARVFSGADRALVAVLATTLQYGSAYGVSIDDPGDVDGDGVPDLLVGSPGAPPVMPGQGGAGIGLVYSGADWGVLYELRPPIGEFLKQGSGVAGPGDVDDDGFPDLATGAPGEIIFTNRVRMYSGAPIGVTSFGSGCAGAFGLVPRIGATRPAKVGASFSVNLSRTAPGIPAVLLLGLSSASWWGIALPYDLGGVGMPGCSLRVSPDVPISVPTSAFGPGNGRGIVPISVPGDPALAGGAFYAQWYVADGAAPFPGSMTRALEIVIQP